MRIFDFKNFVLNERLGLSESSTMFTDIIFKTIFNDFDLFFKSSEKSYSDTAIISYRKLRPFITNLKLYSDFPVVGFEIDLEFKKITGSRFKSMYGDIDITVGGTSSGFGHKNWKNYSKIVKPVKKVSEVGLIIHIGIDIDIDKSTFDIEDSNSKESLVDGIYSTIYHELNHSYEHYKRTIRAPKRGEYRGAIYDRSFNTALTYAENNKWKFPKEIWRKWTNDFLHYIYISEGQELNANVQEMYYFIKKYPDRDLSSFTIWNTADEMDKFDSNKFYQEISQVIGEKYNWNDLGNFLLADCKSTDDVVNRLKDMWVSVYESEVEGQKGKPIIPLETLRKMSGKQFIEYWGRKFNENGKYLKKKIGNIKYQLDNEKI